MLLALLLSLHRQQQSPSLISTPMFFCSPVLAEVSTHIAHSCKHIRQQAHQLVPVFAKSLFYAPQKKKRNAIQESVPQISKCHHSYHGWRIIPKIIRKNSEKSKEHTRANLSPTKSLFYQQLISQGLTHAAGSTVKPCTPFTPNSDNVATRHAHCCAHIPLKVFPHHDFVKNGPQES